MHVDMTQWYSSKSCRAMQYWITSLAWYGHQPYVKGVTTADMLDRVNLLEKYGGVVGMQAEKLGRQVVFGNTRRRKSRRKVSNIIQVSFGQQSNNTAVAN